VDPNSPGDTEEIRHENKQTANYVEKTTFKIPRLEIQIETNPAIYTEYMKVDV